MVREISQFFFFKELVLRAVYKDKIIYEAAKSKQLLYSISSSITANRIQYVLHHTPLFKQVRGLQLNIRDGDSGDKMRLGIC